MRKWLIITTVAGSLVLPASANAATLSKDRGRNTIKAFVQGVVNRMDDGRSAWVAPSYRCDRLSYKKIGCDTTASMYTRYGRVVFCDQMYFATMTPYGAVKVSWVGDPDCHY